uniref:Uncharacterized protein n=1 Tax=Nelumbo nucifera TaxID=4432 RepID=A0A822YBS6_NELNU|nr:TPA_asm: hypothetical protein HUJ06_031230 [Nelumbo nucifera]
MANDVLPQDLSRLLVPKRKTPVEADKDDELLKRITLIFKGREHCLQAAIKTCLVWVPKDIRTLALIKVTKAKKLDYGKTLRRRAATIDQNLGRTLSPRNYTRSY